MSYEKQGNKNSMLIGQCSSDGGEWGRSTVNVMYMKISPHKTKYLLISKEPETEK